MIDELVRPGVQHGEHADGAADVPVIARQLDDRLGRGADVISRIGSHPINRLAEMLPWNWSQPATQGVAA